MKQRIEESPALTRLIRVLLMFMALGTSSLRAQNQYPFQDPNLPIEERVNNIVSLMTLQEKVAFLSARPSVSRLGIKSAGLSEGIHGLAQGGPSNWGRRNPVHTTIFPQGIGLGETWDPDALQQAAGVE